MRTGTAKAMAAAGVLAFSTLTAPLAAQTPAKRTTLAGEDAVKYMYDRGQYVWVKKWTLAMLWSDINQPLVLGYLASSLERLGEKEPAAVFFHILQRVLAEDEKAKVHKDAASLRRLCQARLKVLDVQFAKDRDEHKASAPGRKFTSPEKVSDLWTTQVKADLHCLHGLYAWKLVGGRKDVKKDWIHNAQGEMHRSGAKYVDEVQGRKGVLFSIPNKKSNRLSRLFVTNHGRCRFLRIGTRAYGFSFVLNVVVGGKTIFSRTVGTNAWEDLKVALPPAGQKPADVTIELLVPEDQRWHEGAWFDYVDFFDN